MIYFKLSSESYNSMIHFIELIWNRKETHLNISECIIADARWNIWYSHTYL